MATLFNIAEGWTQRLGPFYFDAKPIGATAFEPLDLTDIDVEFGWSIGATDEWTEAPGTVVIDPDQVTNKGAFYYDPADSDDFAIPENLSKQTLYVRAYGTDSDGKVVPCPSGAAGEIVVHKA